jgi:uncharacterized protein YecT (DUF1311 family)
MKPQIKHVVTLASIAAVVLAFAASVGAPSAGAARTHAARTHAARLSPPVITERFTPLPCAGAPSTRSTIEQEGCAEHQILTSDRKIDALNQTIFAKLSSDAARRHFIAGNAAWLGFRSKYCLSVSDVFAGGTQAPVLEAECVAGLNTEHVKDLDAFVRDLDGD